MEIRRRQSLSVALIWRSLCIAGTLIGALGAAFLSSDNNTLEDIGMIVHQLGLMIMLLGFFMLLILRRLEPPATEAVPRIDATPDGRLALWNIEAEWVRVPVQVLINKSFFAKDKKLKINTANCLMVVPSNFGPTPPSTAEPVEASPEASPLDHRAIDTLAALSNLVAIDFTQIDSIDDQTIEAMECLENIQWIGFSPAISSPRLRRLQTSLPECHITNDGKLIILMESAPNDEKKN